MLIALDQKPLLLWFVHISHCTTIKKSASHKLFAIKCVVLITYVVTFSTKIQDSQNFYFKPALTDFFDHFDKQSCLSIHFEQH